MTHTVSGSGRERSRSLPFPFKVTAAMVSAILILVSPTLHALAEASPDWWKIGQDSPGMQLTARVESRKQNDPNWGGQKTVTIKLSPSGFPKHKQYELWRGRLGREPDRIMGLDFDTEGKLRIIFPQTGEIGQPLSDLPMSLFSFAKGEAIVFAVISTDRMSKAFAQFIPFPLEATDRGCRIWMELTSRDGNAFVVQGEGFEPGEEVSTLSKSNGESLPGREKISSDGKYGPILLFPAAVSGRHKAKYTVKGSSCSVTIKYKWGPPAIKAE